MSIEVSPEEVARALRGVRPHVYRIDSDDDTTRITLVLRVSAAGRRNAAERVVAALAGDGLEPAADDPVEALVAEGNAVAVRRAR
ncbi:hypothetical protein [Saccharomonospora iraqiensis]|uniref:hypothetical protein n=1 Tax=Saccharomonospora iraqiensis TaxID=52698 RepID=UPI00042059FC|nr:hypothetical protein [Saccharomonospora iraqiensis]